MVPFRFDYYWLSVGLDAPHAERLGDSLKLRTL
jgi:hypothetical protein